MLTEKQKTLINWGELLKGLFHSDGSYYQDRGYDYYMFTNYSEDILTIFKECCAYCGVKYTSPTKIRIRIGKRQYVDKLKELIGTKNIMAL